MARPPIVPSNGGVHDKLKNKPLMEAIHTLNNSHQATASWITSDNLKVPRILWHLKNESDEELNAFLDRTYGEDEAKIGNSIYRAKEVSEK